MWKNDTRQSTKMFMDSFKRLKAVMENCVSKTSTWYSKYTSYTDKHFHAHFLLIYFSLTQEPKGKQTLSICARENLKTIEDTLMMVRDILNDPFTPSALLEVNLCFILVCHFFAEIHDHPSFLVANANTDNFS